MLNIGALEIANSWKWRAIPSSLVIPEDQAWPWNICSRRPSHGKYEITEADRAQNIGDKVRRGLTADPQALPPEIGSRRA